MRISAYIMSALCLTLAATSINCSMEKSKSAEPAALTHDQLVSRGRYLVTVGGCNDCHTTKKMVDGRPVPDTGMLLAGHPAGMPLPKMDPAVLKNGTGLYSMDLTTWLGPWGVSFAANITPDRQTGIGAWSKDVFIASIRNGKHMGSGRPILPPMPWEGVAQMTDEDLTAVYTYLMSITPVNNAVPAPLGPESFATMGGR